MRVARATALCLTILGVGLQATPSLAEPLAEYAQRCAWAVGAALPDSMDCLEGTIIPMTGPDGAAQCDKPPYLGGHGCHKNARLQRILASNNNPDVDTYLMCRHYRTSNESDPLFNDIAIIQRNVRNGATCFFQTDSGKEVEKNGAEVPSPQLDKDGFWLQPSETAKLACLGCHDADPLIRTPYVMQVKGKDALPPRRNHHKAYWFPGEDFHSWIAYSVKTNSSNSCTECHVLGTSEPSRDLSSTGGLGAFATGVKRFNLELPDSTPWMLKHYSNNEVAVGSYLELKMCANNHNADGCIVEPRSKVYSGLAAPIAGGGNHTCVITSAGAVQCWGNNEYGQLGNGSTMNSFEPVPVKRLQTGVLEIATGWGHTCALTSAGAVQCWGNNELGQLGNGTTRNSLEPVPVQGLQTGVLAIATGTAHTCAIMHAGMVKCWGINIYSNRFVQRGQTEPVPVKGMRLSPRSIVSGQDHSCILKGEVMVRCWGDNKLGQLGKPTKYDNVKLAGVWGLPTSGLAAIVAGAGHTCALTSVGAVLCWGNNFYGQLGNGTTRNANRAVAVQGLKTGVLAIVTGGFHTCALTSARAVRCWGGNVWGQLGNGTATFQSTVPVRVKGLQSGVLAIAGSYNHTCALKSTGAVLCWGHNYYGQLGNGTATFQSTVPVRVKGL